MTRPNCHVVKTPKIFICFCLFFLIARRKFGKCWCIFYPCITRKNIILYNNADAT